MRMIMALLAVFILPAKSNAQTEGEGFPNRWLIIFDTSADMKPRLPAVRTELTQLLGTSMGSHMLADDSLGIWTFDRTLRTGQFPLESWSPEDAVKISTELNKFLGKQHYSKNTQFSALQPLLSRVMQNSSRLTVVLFCDGEDNISGTPYDNGINTIFQNKLAQQKKDKEPFVLVFRTQQGKFVGCTVNFPPGMLNFPDFPPFRETAPPKPAQITPPLPVATPPPPSPQKIAEPILIIGTNVMSQAPSQPAPEAETVTTPTPPTNAAPPVNPPVVKQSGTVNQAPTNAVASSQNKPPVAVTSPKVETNPPPPAPPPPMAVAPAPVIHPAQPTNATAQSSVVPPVQTNAPPAVIASIPAKQAVATNQPAKAAAPAKKSALSRQGLLAIGATLLLASVILIVLVYMNTRRPSRSSLISQSMRKR
ncbi:MAG: hypothetical protein ACLQU6_15955 [Limisphaerales bacterium]